ncbi:hypothetical protein A1Q2_04456 [Trichosporon asahii var. asahii CBS 8904]|uniref:Uncharacterized protein n=1 Tax=Trichosporon asahii var. asahii (strain CBS 8904) TaxID=1220162 RepID=K1VKE4_TRIAC|nr:hypothetical protein A1Q2_04456 [Trichosporon asahii var. asahii CBS 8904]
MARVKAATVSLGGQAVDDNRHRSEPSTSLPHPTAMFKGAITASLGAHASRLTTHPSTATSARSSALCSPRSAPAPAPESLSNVPFNGHIRSLRGDTRHCTLHSEEVRRATTPPEHGTARRLPPSRGRGHPHHALSPGQRWPTGPGRAQGKRGKHKAPPRAREGPGRRRAGGNNERSGSVKVSPGLMPRAVLAPSPPGAAKREVRQTWVVTPIGADAARAQYGPDRVWAQTKNASVKFAVEGERSGDDDDVWGDVAETVLGEVFG